ncbi:PDZK1-interacting protein 1 [Conger conger]|uniref:PDZK1-interacting protein 1 n=1 Tax=Conger conger TaxID=82655 RepID=UPI002A5A04C4|nr:PDZK1-interacting protein 1 [Conger conger]
MKKVAFTFLWLLLALETVSAQEVGARALPNWLTGIIAVAVFLFLVFVAFLVNKAWCANASQEPKAVPVQTSEDHTMTNGTYLNTSLDMVRTSDHENAYENVAIQKSEDDKITAM